MSAIRVAVVGGSGYVGGELVRLLVRHPSVVLTQVTSERHAGRPVTDRHPNLRKVCALDFRSVEQLEPCDLLFLCLPHGRAMETIDRYAGLAPRLIDLSADFRLHDAAEYPVWYGRAHARPDLLSRFVYGIPEIHRDAIREAPWVSSAGCNATAVILGLHPLFAAGLADRSATVVEAKVGSSALSAAIKEVITAQAVKMPRLAMPLRVMLTGTAHTPSIDAVLELIGRQEVLRRMDQELLRYPGK